MSLFWSWNRLSRSAITSPSFPSEYQVIRSVVVSAATGPPNAVTASRDSAKDAMTDVAARIVVAPLRSPARVRVRAR